MTDYSKAFQNAFNENGNRVWPIIGARKAGDLARETRDRIVHEGGNCIIMVFGVEKEGTTEDRIHNCTHLLTACRTEEMAIGIDRLLTNYPDAALMAVMNNMANILGETAEENHTQESPTPNDEGMGKTQ